MAALGVPWYYSGILLQRILDYVGYIITELHRLLCMWHQPCWVSHWHCGNITYSWCSSVILSSVIPMKSLLSRFSISAGLSLCDTAYLSALSNSLGRSWKRSMIFQIPLPGWVVQVAFLLVRDVRTMSHHPGHQRRRPTVTWLAFLSQYYLHLHCCYLWPLNDKQSQHYLHLHGCYHWPLNNKQWWPHQE